jgi:nickel-dependent lactate racemase
VNLISIDFILNVVLDEKKQIIHAVAGHPITAHRAGCAFLDTLYKCEIERPADLVVVSPGGYRKTSICTRLRKRWTMPGTPSAKAASSCGSPRPGKDWVNPASNVG